MADTTPRTGPAAGCICTSAPHDAARHTYTIAFDELLFACLPDGADLDAALQAEEERAGVTIDRDALTIVTGLTLTDSPEETDDVVFTGGQLGHLSDSTGQFYGYAVRRAATSAPAAAALQAVLDAQAASVTADTLPLPPHPFPALLPIEGAEPFGRARPLGYFIRDIDVLDTFGPDGRHRLPGDAGYLDAHMGRLGITPALPGWRFELRRARWLCALVGGNAVLMASQACRLGYRHASADGPNVVRLAEVGHLSP